MNNDQPLTLIPSKRGESALELDRLSDFHLSHRIKVVVPGTRNVNEPLSLAEKTRWSDSVLKAMALKFGGATRRESVGAYVDSNGNMVLEHVFEIESAVEDIDLHTARFAFRLAEILARALSQESVALYIDNNLYFV